MTLDYHFNTQRFSNLIRREVYSNIKLYLIALGAVSGITFVIFTFALVVSSNESQVVRGHEFFTPYFIVSYIIMGIIITSVAYRDFLHPHKRYAYLTLPVSNFERFLSMLLLTTVGYTISFIVYFYAYTTFLNIYGMVFSAYQFEMFDINQYPIWMAIKIYMVVQSVFLVGAASFKKYPLLLTLLTGFGVQFALSLLLMLAGLIIFQDFIDQDFNKPGVNQVVSEDFKAFVEFDLLPALEFVGWYCLAPFFWVVTYFKIKEKEA